MIWAGEKFVARNVAASFVVPISDVTTTYCARRRTAVDKRACQCRVLRSHRKRIAIDEHGLTTDARPRSGDDADAEIDAAGIEVVEYARVHRCET